jgi:hypothetical protein
MYGRIALELCLGEKRSRVGDSMIDPDKWAETIENELRQREEADANKGEIFLAKRRLLDSQSPLLWKELAQTMRDLATAFNKRRNILTIHDEGESLSVRRSDDMGAAHLSAGFLRPQNKITLMIQPGSLFQSYAAKVIPGTGEGVVCLVREDSEAGSKTQYSVEEIATAAMEELIKMRP